MFIIYELQFDSCWVWTGAVLMMSPWGLIDCDLYDFDSDDDDRQQFAAE